MSEVFKCQLCGKPYRSIHWLVKHYLRRHQVEDERKALQYATGELKVQLDPNIDLEEIFEACPKCNFNNTVHNAACWRCGYVLDRRLIELYEKQRGKKI